MLKEGDTVGLLVPAGELTVMKGPGAPATCNYRSQAQNYSHSLCNKLIIIHTVEHTCTLIINEMSC